MIDTKIEPQPGEGASNAKLCASRCSQSWTLILPCARCYVQQKAIRSLR